jgi:uncharacterized membrane protein
MATLANGSAMPRRIDLRPDRLERILGALTIVLLCCVLVALGRGAADWGRLPGVLWLHLATMVTTLALTPAILWMPRGTRLHRQLGYAWVTALGLTAIDSFAIRSGSGAMSAIHILSVVTLCALPPLVITARRHDHARHRRIVRGLVIGALLTAGFFTFPFDRMLGHWLFG